MCLPNGFSDATLRGFILELSVQSGSPTDAAIRGNHISNGSSSHGCRISFGHGYELSSLISTPTLSLQAHACGIDWKLFQELVCCAHDAIICRFGRMSNLVADVWNEHKIARRSVFGRINRTCRGTRSLIVVKIIRVQFIVVKNEWILFRRIVISRFVEDSFEVLSVVGFPFHDFTRRPIVVRLLWIRHRQDSFRLILIIPQFQFWVMRNRHPTEKIMVFIG